MATTGPPPGLGMRVPAGSSLPPNPFSTTGQGSPAKPAASPALQQADVASSTRVRPSSCPRTYARATLLAYSSSPLVRQPPGMAPLREWFGEWEPYQHKSVPYQYRDSPRRNADDSTASTEGDHSENTSSGGLIGGALGGFGPKRGDGAARFGRRQDDRERGEGGLRLGALPSRGFPPSGKNPFGQVSASGTFRPAGSVGGPGGREREPRGPRDGGNESPSEFRRFPLSDRSTSFGKERNRDRDAPPHLAASSDDRSRGGLRDRFGEGERSGSGRDFGGLRDRRRGGALEGDGEHEEAGEPVESTRTRKTGGADLVSDWRKPSDKDRFNNLTRSGVLTNGATDRLKGERFNRERNGKGLPSWMGDGEGTESPAWMDEETSSPLTTPSKVSNFGAFGRRKDAESEAGRAKEDLGGAIDSIQAFKAQMKERERLEREKATGSSTFAGSSGGRMDEYDFKSDNNKDHESHQDQIGYKSDVTTCPTEQPPDRPSGDAKDGAASSGVASSGPPPGLYDTMSNSYSNNSTTEPPPGLPGRSSRFARFFDGRPGMRDPQTAALAAQQRLLESRGDMMSAPPSNDRLPVVSAKEKETSEPASASPSPAVAQAGQNAAPGINIADLFKQTSAKDGGNTADGQARGPAGANPSEADVQSMQKLMAMLQAGGGSQSGGPHSNDGRDTATSTSAHDARPESVNRMRELLGGNGATAPGSQSGQRINGMALEDERSHMMSPNLNGAHAPHAYGFPPGIGMGMQQQQHQQQQQQQQHKNDPGLDQRGQHSRVVSTSSLNSQQMQQRSQSPALQPAASPYSDHAATHRGQQAPGLSGLGGGPNSRPGDAASLSPYGFPSPGPGPNNITGRPPFALDPRMMGRPPMGAPGLGSPGPGQLPPHIAAALGLGRGPVLPPGLAGPPPPSGMGGPRGAPPMSGAFPNFPPFGGRPPPPGMPPQLYQQLMSLPPHLQQQLLSGQGMPAHGPGLMPGQGGSRSPYDMLMQPQPQHQGGPMPSSPQPHGQQQQQPHQGGMSSPPMPPGISPVGSQAMNGANLMALLSGAHRGPGSN